MGGGIMPIKIAEATRSFGACFAGIFSGRNGIQPRLNEVKRFSSTDPDLPDSRTDLTDDPMGVPILLPQWHVYSSAAWLSALLRF